jgi:hypothetical protein
MHLKAGDVNDCEGCLTDTGRLFSGCSNCQVRACASVKKMENCAYCSDYVCETLRSFFEKEPDSKNRLDKIRSLLS